MIVRKLKPADIPVLQRLYESTGFEYEFPNLHSMESVMVVADPETDAPIMAAAAEKLIQLYLFAPVGGNPLAKLHAIRLLHDAMRTELRKLGYTSAEAFLPPSIADKFGRRLERTFGWWRNAWKSWTIRF